MAEGGWQIETCDGGDTAASVTLLERLSAPVGSALRRMSSLSVGQYSHITLIRLLPSSSLLSVALCSCSAK